MVWQDGVERDGMEQDGVERDDLWKTSNHRPNVEANSSETPGERIIKANDNV